MSWNINEIKQSNRIQGRKIMYLFKLVEENVIDFCDALFKKKDPGYNILQNIIEMNTQHLNLISLILF